MGLVVDYSNKSSINKASRHLFAGEGSCLQFAKSATVKRNKVRCNKTRYACTHFCNAPGLLKRRLLIISAWAHSPQIVRNLLRCSPW